jgi:hypothetical protein
LSASPAKHRDSRAQGAATGLPGEPTDPDGPRRPGLLPLVFGLLLAAAVGFLIWYLLVRDDTPEALPAVPAGEVSLDVEHIDFGDENVGGVSVTQDITLTNGTAEPIRVEDVELEGEAAEDFDLLEPDCLNARLDAGGDCGVSVRFRPQEPGGRAARLVFSLDGGPGERSVELAGIGTGRATLVVETSRLDFGERDLEATADSQQIALLNAGDLALHIRRAVVVGPAADDFTLGRRARCLGGQELAAGASCVLTVSFVPKDDGERAAVLELFHDAADAPARIRLRGIGVGRPEAVLSPTSLVYGELVIGTEASPRTVTLRNGGTGPLAVAWIAVSGPDDGDFTLASGGTCRKGTALDPGGSCTVLVRFTPTVAGGRTASLVVATDDPAGFSEVELNGDGAEPPEEVDARTTPAEVPTIGPDGTVPAATP